MENIINRPAQEQYISDLALYSVAVNLVRALPDVRDGLKPVARRILFALLNDEKAISKSTKVKSAAVEGTVMKKYHPHSGTYQSFKNLINWFEIKQPLIIGQGSFGTVSGEGPSAQRYTECYLSPFGLECVCGALAKTNDVVDWQDTYTSTYQEPSYLPVKVPLLLVNGIVGGIGLGVKADLPPHNLGEVIDATRALIDNPNANVMLIPDHCLPCQIVDTDWKNICNKGFGSYKARANIEIYKDNKDYPIVAITSLPTYGSNDIVQDIETKFAKQIVDINDESKNEYGIRIIIKLKKGSNAEFFREQLYKYTDCEKSFRVNFEAVYDKRQLMRFSYKSYLQTFIMFAIDNKIKEYSARHAIVSTKIHKLDGFIKIVGSPDIDKIITMIKNKKADSDNELVEMLIDKYHLSDIQAKYIIDAQIKQLSKGYLELYKKNFSDLTFEEHWLEERIANPSLIRADVKAELKQIKQKYATPRICPIVKVNNDSNIPSGRFTIAIMQNNYIRKVNTREDSYLTIKGVSPKYIHDVDNTDNLLLFGSKGKVYKLPVHKIPIVDKTDLGVDIRLVIKGLTADIIEIMYEPDVKYLASLIERHYLVILSKNNTIKKLDINDFLNVPPSGLLYSKLNGDDEIVSIQIVNDSMDLVLYSESQALRIHSTDVALLKRNTLGTLGMGGDHGLIEGMSVIYPGDTNKYIFVSTAYGNIKKFPSTGFECSQRNKPGQKVIDLSRGDRIVDLFVVSDTDTIQCATSEGFVNIVVSDIPLSSSMSKGIKCKGISKTNPILHSSILR